MRRAANLAFFYPTARLFQKEPLAFFKTNAHFEISASRRICPHLGRGGKNAGQENREPRISIAIWIALRDVGVGGGADTTWVE